MIESRPSATRPSTGGQACPQIGDDARPQIGRNAHPQVGDDARPQVGAEAPPKAGDDARPRPGDATPPDICGAAHRPDTELQAIAERYARRDRPGRYSMLQPDVWHSLQERQRAMLRLFVELGWHDLARLRAAEIGCGAGGNLLELLRLGFAPENLIGAELLPERFKQARRVLPQSLALWQGDASRWAVAPGSQHLVLQSTVFSSLLDDAFHQQLATAMWRWVAPGGGVLWYDLRVNNPRNPDVRGVALKRLRELFPQARMQHRRVTLAPPIARAVCRIHPMLYPVFNAVPLLRTHVLVWLEKPAA